MKKVFLILSVLFIGATGFAQNKNAKATIEVVGVCGMCKERIEKASIQANSSDWSRLHRMSAGPQVWKVRQPRRFLPQHCQ